MLELLPLPFIFPANQRLYKAENATVNGPKVFVELIQNNTSYTEIRAGFDDLINDKQYQNAKKGMYWYELTSQNITYAGVVLGIPVSCFQKKLITTHENTLPKRVKLFTSYLDQTKIQTEPLVVLHEEKGFTSFLSKGINLRQACHEFTLEDEIHRLWHLTEKEKEQVSKMAQKQLIFHLADGHHRLESTIQFALNQNIDLPVQCMLLEKNQIRQGQFIWALKKQLKGIDLQVQIEKYKAKQLTEYDDTHRIIKINHEGIVSQLEVPTNENPAIFLVEKLLNLNIDTDKVHRYFDYFPVNESTEGLMSNTYSKYQATMIFSKIPIDEVISRAKLNQILPPKSTYLYPKLPTGLIVSPSE